MVFLVVPESILVSILNSLSLSWVVTGEQFSNFMEATILMQSRIQLTIVIRDATI